MKAGNRHSLDARVSPYPNRLAQPRAAAAENWFATIPDDRLKYGLPFRLNLDGSAIRRYNDYPDDGYENNPFPVTGLPSPASEFSSRFYAELLPFELPKLG